MTATPMLDLNLPSPRLPGRSAHGRASIVVTGVFHAAAVAGLIALTLGGPHRDGGPMTTRAAAAPAQVPRLIFLQMPGPGGGGGGGGNRQHSPPSLARN